MHCRVYTSVSRTHDTESNVLSAISPDTLHRLYNESRMEYQMNLYEVVYRRQDGTTSKVMIWAETESDAMSTFHEAWDGRIITVTDVNPHVPVNR